MNVTAKDNAFIYIMHIQSSILCRWLQRSTELMPKSNGFGSMFFIGRAQFLLRASVFFRPEGYLRCWCCIPNNHLLRLTNYFLLLDMTDVHSKEIRSYNMSRIIEVFLHICLTIKHPDEPRLLLQSYFNIFK